MKTCPVAGGAWAGLFEHEAAASMSAAAPIAILKRYFAPTISAVEQWYIMVGEPKHQIRSLSSCVR